MESLDRLLERVAPDEPHRVVRAAIVVGTQTVDRHDAGVFEPTGDLGFQEKSLSAGRVVGVESRICLSSHLAMQLGVKGDEDGTSPPLA